MNRVSIFHYDRTGVIGNTNKMSMSDHVAFSLKYPDDLWMLGSPRADERVDVTDPNNHFKTSKIDLPYSVDKLTIAADGIDKAFITGLPELTLARYYDGTVEQIDETGETFFAIDVPGDYEIVFEHGAYYSQTITITAEPVA